MSTMVLAESFNWSPDPRHFHEKEIIRKTYFIPLYSHEVGGATAVIVSLSYVPVVFVGRTFD
jgi:hypothetical protein